ncbi:glycosyltransferase family 2 protein [Xylanimonas allomyrinae]|uniref:Glycosyltransferase family 2 protein n=1 Tax=Xylanimonas allomyrinae TaxID=2509459 RepID=A0A4P6EMT1_9MICO|nr:glycosyltransferase family A protein [Xylanimonas allomyrinae]QAY63974.1 glycosyltransferase family 2 protein [Xylanimonas allomyrinae]
MPPSRDSDRPAGRPAAAPLPGPGDLAVVVCSRDRADLLRRSLARIAQATPSGVDVLVVDSGSRTGDTLAAAADAGVRAVRSDVPGLSIARNLGLASTDRPIVLFTDDDCLAVEGWTGAVLAGFGDPQVVAVTGRMLDHTLAGTPGAAPQPARHLRRVVEGLDAGHGALMAFRRARVLAVGGFDDVLGAGRELAGAEDLDMFCRLIAAGGVVVQDEASVVLHANTREGDDHARLYRGYGLGLGALVAKWLRLDATTGARLAATVVRRAVLRWLRAGTDRRARAAQGALLAGAIHGWRTARHLRLRAGVFVDDRPPEPVPAPAPGRPARSVPTGLAAATVPTGLAPATVQGVPARSVSAPPDPAAGGEHALARVQARGPGRTREGADDAS